MESPLSFDSTENFRKKLLVRNLKPYNVPGGFSSNELGSIREFNIVDYSVIDSESIEIIGDRQEKILYTNNKYGPTSFNNSYGDTVNINLNLGTESNFGSYDIGDTVNSKLYQVGNTQENLLYVQNIYGPTEFNTSYGETVDINKNLQTLTNQGVYGYSKALVSNLSKIGNQKEGDLIVKNIYKPSFGNKNFGDTKWSINNDQTITTVGGGLYDIKDTVGSRLETVGNSREIFSRTKNKYTPASGDDYGVTKYSINNDLGTISNLGEYDLSDTVGDLLELKGITKRKELFPSNQYGPIAGQSATVVNPNLNFQTNPNEGNYDSSDAIGSILEKVGISEYGILRPINQYGPLNIGNASSYNILLPNKSNEGEYDITDTKGAELEVEGKQQRNILFPTNQYGPEAGQSTSEVNPNQNLQVNSNEGNYDTSDAIGSNLEVIGSNEYKLLQPINQYGPEIIENASSYNVLVPTKPNEGSYSTSDSNGSELEINGNVGANDAYIINKYVTGDGNYDSVTIDDIILQTTSQKYYNSKQSFAFLPSEYSPISLLLSSNPNGSNGSLSQDSDLARVAAKQLQKEFKYRVAAQLLSETLGRVNALDSSIDPDSGELSVKPKLDPFNAVGIIAGKVPLLQRNYKVTSADSLLGKAVSFAGKLGGIYSPYSIIPDTYFDYPKPRLLNSLIENPIGLVTQSVMGAVRKITSRNIDSGSELFLAYTSPATRDLLWGQIFYNEYRPDYRGNSARNPNLFSPKPNFYIGSRKTSISEMVAPVNTLPEYKDGEPQVVPTYGPVEVAREFDGNKLSDLYIGSNSRAFYDGISPLSSDFSWSTKKNFFKAGKKVGREGKQNFGKSTVYDVSLKREFEDSQSYNYDLREGSILDITQKIVDSGSRNGVKPLRHIGNAINQVSKVFNDGYVEMTKGSRAIKYKTKNSVESTNKEYEGFEYCRIFTKDNPFFTYSQLQKTDGNIRKYTYSILDNTYNLNIAPMNDKNGQSTNIVNGKVKKYMFSLENLAWRTSNKEGFTYEDLPACEKGPNGGRIMWFPPYDLSFSESSKPDFQDNTFIGRPEPIYTYKNTSRGGSISWSIIVDHPSISNLLINEELKKVTPESEITKIMASFFAGCLKYDLYELTKKYVQFSPKDIQEAVKMARSKEDVEKVVKELPESEPKREEIIESTPSKDLEKEFKEIYLFFENDLPDDGGKGDESDKDYDFWYNEYMSNKSNYTGDNTKIIDQIKRYPTKTTVTPKTLPNSSTEFSLKDYIDARKSAISSFFTGTIEPAKSKFDEFISQIAKVLDAGGKVSFSLLGTASSVQGADYNKKLSKRRISSIRKKILAYEYNGKKLETYVTNKSLNIKEDPQGDSAASISNEQLKDINCSLKFKATVNGVVVGSNAEEGIYSVQAMACRRTKVYDLKIDPAPPPKKEEPVSDGVLPQTNAANVDNQNPPTPQNQNGSPVDLNSPFAQGLTKKLIRNLLTECDYFQMIKETQPMVYDGIKSKFKNFHPLFHSITPEGLNARLTFLQQCVRPGDTIPTITENGAGGSGLNYQDAFNSAFGAPPVLVLRIGDFYNTKIIPDNLDIKFEDGAFLDMNPEGIGVQPMKATITLSFKFIGGSGLAGPVSQLQNALSFNYYANTEMYDERAEVTEVLERDYDSEFYAAAKTNEKPVPQNNIESEPANPIGVRGTTNVGADGLTFGNIAYEKLMKDFIKASSDYSKNLYESLKLVGDDYSLGGLYILNTDRKYQEGYFNSLNQPNINLVKIYGKSEKFQNKIDLLFSKTKEDIENDIIPILGGIDQPSNNFSNSDKRKVKRKLKRMVDDRKNDYVQNLTTNNQKIVDNEILLSSLIDQLNFITNATDGFKNTRGNPIIYSLTGTTSVDASNTSYPNTLDELRGDFLKVGTDLNNLISNLETEKIIQTDPKEKWQDNFDFNLYLGSNQTSPQDNRMNMVFGKDIVKDITKFINEILDVVNDKDSWRKYLQDNLGYSDGAEVTGGIYSQYKNQKENILKNRFENFFTKFFNVNFTLYKPFNLDKKRVLDFTTQVPTNQSDADNLINLGVNSTGDKYNLKKKFN
jgi:hypothetical protein